MLCFRLWLEHRPQKVPDAGALALAIAQSGAAGVSREGLARAVGIPEEAVDVLLRGVVASGPVVMLKVDGQLVYRAAGQSGSDAASGAGVVGTAHSSEVLRRGPNLLRGARGSYNIAFAEKRPE
jgi:hypothetical protein